MADDQNIQNVILNMMNQLGGIEQFQNNPMAFIGEIFKHPDLLAQIDQLSKTPEMQQQIAQSMNNPMFQQIVANNPMLAGLMQNYKNRAQNHASQDDIVDIDADADAIDAFDDTDTTIPYDFPIDGWHKIDWLNPPYNQPFSIPDLPEERVKFDDILQEIPEECRDNVKNIALKRLQMHLSQAALDALDAKAQPYDLTALDLVATQGFIGEVAYCASLIMPDDDLCDLAKFALATLHKRSGYPVPSYIAQILLYIDSFDDIDTQDWENFVWSLSANPSAPRDGNFFIFWDDAVTIAEIAADQLSDSPDLLLAVVLALLNWSVLSLDDITTPVQTLLKSAPDKEILAKKLSECLDGKKCYAMALNKMREKVIADAKVFVKNNSNTSL